MAGPLDNLRKAAREWARRGRSESAEPVVWGPGSAAAGKRLKATVAAPGRAVGLSGRAVCAIGATKASGSETPKQSARSGDLSPCGRGEAAERDADRLVLAARARTQSSSFPCVSGIQLPPEAQAGFGPQGLGGFFGEAQDRCDLLPGQGFEDAQLDHPALGRLEFG